MKIRDALIVPCASFVLFAAAPAHGADKISFGNHMDQVFTEVCKILVTDACKKTLSAEDRSDIPSDVTTCVSSLSGSMDSATKKLEVPASWSKKCVASLKSIKLTDCQDTMTAMASGECDSQKMK